MVLYWVGCVDSMKGNSDKAMLGERVLVEGVSMIRVVGNMEVSS